MRADGARWPWRWVARRRFAYQHLRSCPFAHDVEPSLRERGLFIVGDSVPCGNHPISAQPVPPAPVVAVQSAGRTRSKNTAGTVQGESQPKSTTTVSLDRARQKLQLGWMNPVASWGPAHSAKAYGLGKALARSRPADMTRDANKQTPTLTKPLLRMLRPAGHWEFGVLGVLRKNQVRRIPISRV